MKSLLGLDIGSHSIKLIELSSDGKIPTLMAAGSIATPPKALASNLPADTESVAMAIKKLIHDTGAKSRRVAVALPESQVFSRVIQMPSLSSRELASALQWEAEQYIPLPLNQVSMDYSVLRDAKATGNNTMEVLLVASPKSVLEKYVTLLEMVDVEIVGIETQITAVSRALFSTISPLGAVMVIGMGAQTTDLAILRRGILTFTRSISAGGDAFTRAMIQNLGFEQLQAEEYKRTYGVEADKLEGKLVTAVKPIMDVIVNEIRRADAFYQEKFKNEHIDAFILCGGAARLPGMVVYMANALGSGVDVQLANPWLGMQKDARFSILDKEGPVFTTAVGLAMR